MAHPPCWRHARSLEVSPSDTTYVFLFVGFRPPCVVWSESQTTDIGNIEQPTLAETKCGKRDQSNILKHKPLPSSAKHPCQARVHTVDDHERRGDGMRGYDIFPVHLPAISSSASLRSSCSSKSLITSHESFGREHREFGWRDAAGFDHRFDARLGI